MERRFDSPLDADLHVKIWAEPDPANLSSAVKAGVFTYDDVLVCELNSRKHYDLIREKAPSAMATCRDETKKLLERMGLVMMSDWTRHGGDDDPWMAALGFENETPIIPASLQEKAGDDFMEAIKLAVEKRVERRGQYGDSYKVDELLYQFYLARAKLMRFRTQLTTTGEREEVKNLETALDSLVDSMCYTAFAVEGLVKRHMNVEKGSAA
jgi:hypothetical protein